MRRLLLSLDLVLILLISDSAGHHGAAGFMQLVVGSYNLSFAELAEGLVFLDEAFVMGHIFHSMLIKII